MSNDPLDLAFAKHVRQIGLVTQEQVNAALATQAGRLQEGKTTSFSEILVEMGLLTAAQRETLEKKVKDQQAGVQQLGAYKLLRKLGEGGMGAVYLATDAAGKSVAVKVLPRHLGANTEFVKRFKREAEAATRLQHPNIIGAFATGEDLGYHYYVMAYCDGQGLDKLLAAKKMLPVAQALTIALEVARGLKYAHDLGIVHRDIKPSNIMLDRDGQAKILDLGLSKTIGDSTASFKTVTGAVLGTPHYISPEQAQGERGIDGRSDIYSLGATVYHLITGKTPFDGATALEILSKHVHTVLPNPQDLREGIPDPVVQILERMMAKDPRDRHRDCGELITDLIEASQGRAPKSEVIAASLSSIAPPARRVLKKRPHTLRRGPAPRKPKTLMIAGGVAAAVLVALVVLLPGRHEPPRETVTPPPAQPRAAIKDPEPSRGGFDVATWEKSLAELPPEARVKAVHARLRTLNPGYDSSQADHHIAHGRVTRLRIASPALKDVTPIRALADLRELELPSTGVTDLSPLRDSKLTLLVLDGSKLSDLRPLRDMRELAILSLASTPVRDLSPLEGLDLARLTLTGCLSAELSALRRVKLRELHCDFDPKRDTDTLKSMPTLEQINGVPVEEFWRKLRATEPAPAVVTIPVDPLGAALARLKQLNPEWGGRETHTLENGEAVELVIIALGITDISPLASLKSLRKLDLSGYWSQSEKREYRSSLSDLSPLRGLKLKDFRAHHTDAENLAPLEGMPLEYLEMTGVGIRDLAPLRGMPLKYLDLSFTRVKDVSVVAGLPLTELRLEGSDVVDFSPIQGLKLTVLTANLDLAKHRALIESIRTLARVNGYPVNDFLRPAAPAGPPLDAAQWKTALDLLPHMDPIRDTVAGPWRKADGKIYCDGGENAVLRINYEPPAEYDFRIVYQRSDSHCATCQFLVHDGRGFFWEMGGYGKSHSGFSQIAGRGSADNPTRATFVPVDGVRYVSTVQVRKDRVTAFLDGRKLSEWVPSMGDISTDAGWCVDAPGLIGLGNCESRTVFESVQVREITGKGKLRAVLATPVDPAFLKAVAPLGAAEQVRRVTEKLKELNPQFDPGALRYKIENERVTELSLPTMKVFDAWPVRAFPALRKLDLGEERSPSILTDVGFLKGMKLQELGLSGTRVTDLAPLQGMPLARLSISGTPVKDFAPLKGLPLQKLDCANLQADPSALKSIRTLKTVNDLPAADFFKGAKEGWSPIFDGRTTDCLRRNGDGWKVDRGALQNDPTIVNSAQTNFEFENGDLRLRFECRGVDALTFRIRQNAQGASGIFFDAATARTLEGRPHELLFSCRGETVTAVMDGKPIPLTETAAARPGCLQFNATNGALRVTSVEFRPAP